MCEAISGLKRKDSDHNCRLCLSSTGLRFSIFSTEVCDQNDVSLCDKILQCVSLQVSEQENLPTLICFRCLYKVNEYYEFQELCKKTDLILRDASIKNEVKLEEEEEEEVVVEFCKYTVTKHAANDLCDDATHYVTVTSDHEVIGQPKSELFEEHSDEEGAFDSNMQDNFSQFDIEAQQSEISAEIISLPFDVSATKVDVNNKSLCISLDTLKPLNSNDMVKKLDFKTNDVKTKAQCKRKLKCDVPNLVQVHSSTLKKSRSVGNNYPHNLISLKLQEPVDRYRCKYCLSCWASAELLHAHELRAHQPKTVVIGKATNSQLLIPRTLQEPKILPQNVKIKTIDM